MRLGVPYYFEQWPRERWDEDLRLMREAGLDFVRMGEFAWSELEPREGEYRFGLLDEAMELFSQAGMRVILGTPSPAYPPWLHLKYPDLHQRRSDGRVKEYGHRQDACKNHGGYRAAVMEIVREMARRYGGDPRVGAWQIDNEVGNHGTESCWCERCEAAFREWLRNRYCGDVEALNADWGTSFWSQRYSGFDEVSLPRDSADRSWDGGQNPGLLLDFARFSSAVQCRFVEEQAAAIRERDPSATITHNLMAGYYGVDYFRLAESLDVVSWDNYPFMELEGRARRAPALGHALARGLKGSGGAWVMEQATGPGGLDRAWPTPEPGRMRLWAWQSVARGADLLCFYRWRTSLRGAEQFWHGVLSHDGRPGRRYEELAAFSRELERVWPSLEGSGPKSRVAVLLDYESAWASRFQPLAREGTLAGQAIAPFAAALESAGIDYDVAGLRSRLEGYDAVLAMSLFLLSEEGAAALRNYVAAGGTLVLGPLSAVKEPSGAVRESRYPGPLALVAGCRVREYDAFSWVPGASVDLVLEGGRRIRARGIAELLEPLPGARVLARYSEGRYYGGEPAAVASESGSGRCIYIGAALDEEGAAALVLPALAAAGVECRRQPENVEIASREGPAGRLTFYLNHGDAAARVALARPGAELLGGSKAAGALELGPLGVAVVLED